MLRPYCVLAQGKAPAAGSTHCAPGLCGTEEEEEEGPRCPQGTCGWCLMAGREGSGQTANQPIRLGVGPAVHWPVPPLPRLQPLPAPELANTFLSVETHCREHLPQEAFLSTPDMA